MPALLALHKLLLHDSPINASTIARGVARRLVRPMPNQHYVFTNQTMLFGETNVQV